MTADEDTFQRIAEYLRQTVAPGKREMQITLDSEVYYDLGVYGHDLLELVLWLQREFGVEPNLVIGDYAPGEIPFFRLWKLLRRREQRFKSLKVRDVVAAIESKQWFASGGR